MSGFEDNTKVIGAVPELPAYKIPDKQWRNGLLIRSPNWLGDAVMTLPAINQIRKIVPERCDLAVICPPVLKSFYESLPMFKTVIALHKAHSMWKWSEINQVRHLNMGVALLFNNSIRDPFMLRMAMVPKIFGTSARCRSFLMTKTFAFPKRISQGLNEQHHAAKYLAMAMALGAPVWEGELPEFKIKKDPAIIDRLLLQLSRQEHIMTLAAGAAYGEAKRWPTEYFKEVSRWWINKGGSILVVGTAKEHEIGQRIIEKLPDDKAYNLAGKTDLCELMMLLQKAEICIANDSGTMHLSAALNSPGIAIFGSTDPSATSPISAKWKVIYDKQDCSPCFKRECPLGSYKCLKVITPDIVISELEKLKK